jgi:hypothetical protein
MQLTDAECRALAKHPATVLAALIEVAQSLPDLNQLVLAIAHHPQKAELSHVYDHRRGVITTAIRRYNERLAEHNLDGRPAVALGDDAAAVGT